MLKTTDGGIKWEEMGLNVLPGLHCVGFFDEKAGFVCGDGTDAFPSGVFTTSDGGRTWRPVPGVKLASCRRRELLSGDERRRDRRRMVAARDDQQRRCVQ